MTFSIVGYDPQTKELGVAVASKFLAVGAVVPFAKAEVDLGYMLYRKNLL